MKIQDYPKPLWSMDFGDDTGWQFHMRGAPCWIHRIIQRWLLGIRWKRIPQPSTTTTP